MFIAEYVNGNFHYLRINSAHQKLSGFENKEVQGKTPEEVWGELTAKRLHAFYLQGLRSPRGHYAGGNTGNERQIQIGRAHV